MEDIYYKKIKEELISNEAYNKVKDYSKNKHDLETRYNVGQLLIEAQGDVERAKYGDGLIKEYSKRLVSEIGKQYGERNLRNMRQFYLLFKDEIWHSLNAKLSWSHYKELLILQDINKINYYIDIAIKKNLSYRKLHDIIKSNEYERLPEETKVKLINNEEPTLPDTIKEPIIIRNPNNIKVLKEKTLQMLILEDLPHFIEELGEGFCFIKNEYPIKIGKDYHHIDLLLFNYIYNCFVVIEIKITNFKAEYIGQVLKYINYIDKNIKSPTHNNTIGIIFVQENNRLVLEYSTDPRIIAKEYVLN